MTEPELTTEVIQLAQKYGALVHHCKDSRHCEGDKGFPDLLIAGPGGVVIAELKNEYRDTDPDQQNWEYMLRITSVDDAAARMMHTYCLWRPEDLEDGTVEKMLRKVMLIT